MASLKEVMADKALTYEKLTKWIEDNGNNIPYDEWYEWRKGLEDTDQLHNFEELKLMRFQEPKVNKDGEVVGRKIYYNALRKYYQMIRPTHFVTEDLDNMYQWNGKYYDKVSTAELDAFLFDTILEPGDEYGIAGTETSKFRTNVLAVNRISFSQLEKTTEFKMNFNNGTLNVKTMKFYPHTPDDFFRYAIEYDYTEDDTPTTNWDKLLKLITVDRPELVDLLEFYFGYILSQDNTNVFQFFMVLFGGGENGKTFLLNCLKYMLHPALYTTEKVMKISTDKFAKASLEGKITLISDDEDAEMFKNPNFLKELVGGNDTVSVEKKFQQSYDMRVRAKPIITTNHIPFCPDVSHGFFRRFLLIPLDLYLPKVKREALVEYKRDPNNEEKNLVFFKEYPAIIRKCLNNYYAKRKTSKLEIPAIVKEFQERASTTSDKVSTWFDLNLVYTNNREHVIPVKDLFEVYGEEVDKGSYNKKKIGNFKAELKNWVMTQSKIFYMSHHEPFAGEVNEKDRVTYKIKIDRRAGIIFIDHDSCKYNCFNDAKNEYFEGRIATALIGFMFREQAERYNKEHQFCMSMNVEKTVDFYNDGTIPF